MKMQYPKTRQSDVRLSKKLSWLLRHGATELAIQMNANGYILVSEILKHQMFALEYSLPLIKQIVDADSKKRFSLRQDPTTGEYEVRANQGHSMNVVKDGECLEKVLDVADVPLAVHGTYYRHWKHIQREGLRTMHRNHIHFAITDKIQKSGSSGIRGNCEVLIYLNIPKVMKLAAFPLYRSANNVILTSGIEGIVSKDYFEKVLDRKSGIPLQF